MNNKKRFEAGHAFRVTPGGLFFKLTGDHYGKDFISVLIDGAWSYACAVEVVTETAVMLMIDINPFAFRFDCLIFED
jgi:hypothetical protein